MEKKPTIVVVIAFRKLKRDKSSLSVVARATAPTALHARTFIVSSPAKLTPWPEGVGTCYRIGWHVLLKTGVTVRLAKYQVLLNRAASCRRHLCVGGITNGITEGKLH